MFYTELEHIVATRYADLVRDADRQRLLRLARAALVAEALVADQQSDDAQSGRRAPQPRPQTARALDLKPRQAAW